jgi:hypothetical protein
VIKKRKHKKRERGPALEFVGSSEGVFIDGVRIARRGYPGTPQAKIWVSLEPGWRVLDAHRGQSIVIERNGVRVQQGAVRSQNF